MIINGKQIDINEWNPPDDVYKQIFADGWRSFKEYNYNFPEDTYVQGYRILYQNEGKYYSPFVKGGIQNAGKYPEKSTPIEQYLESPTPNGYYYFVDKEIAENYLAALIITLNKSMVKDPGFRPVGTLQIHRVEGMAAGGPSTYNDEGDRLKEMYTYGDPHLIVDLQELYPK